MKTSYPLLTLLSVALVAAAPAPFVKPGEAFAAGTDDVVASSFGRREEAAVRDFSKRAFELRDSFLEVRQQGNGKGNGKGAAKGKQNAATTKGKGNNNNANAGKLSSTVISTARTDAILDAAAAQALADAAAANATAVAGTYTHCTIF